MTHNDYRCDGTITIETDPKNDDYKMVEGVKKKAESWTAASTETIDLPDEAAKAKLASDPMYRLEHGEADKTKARVKKSSLARLLKAKSAVHDYDANAKLRGAFRVKRKQLKAQHAADQALMAKASLYGSQVQLLPESASDKQLAARMTFGGGGGGGGAAIVGRGGRNGAGSAGGARDAIMQQKRAIQKGSIFDARGTVRGGASSSSSGSKTKRIKLESSKSGVTTTTSSTTSSMQSSSRPSTGKLRTNASSSRVQSSGHEVFGGAHGARRGAAGLRALGIGKGIDISSFRLLKSSSRGGIGGEAWAGVGGATNVAEGEMAARLQAGGLVATKRTRRGRKGKAAAAAAAGDGGRGGLSLVDDYSDDPD